MAEPEESLDNYLEIMLNKEVNAFRKFARRRQIKNMVMQHGRLTLSPEDNSQNEETLEIEEEFVRKYNPQGLNHEEYRDAYLKEELAWQQENTAKSLFVNKEIEKRFHKLK